MGVLDDAIREHLELKRRHGATDEEIAQAEAEALGPARREPAAEPLAAGQPFSAGAETELMEPAGLPLEPVAEEDLLEPEGEYGAERPPHEPEEPDEPRVPLEPLAPQTPQTPQAGGDTVAFDSLAAAESDHEEPPLDPESPHAGSEPPLDPDAPHVEEPGAGDGVPLGHADAPMPAAPYEPHGDPVRDDYELLEPEPVPEDEQLGARAPLPPLDDAEGLEPPAPALPPQEPSAVDEPAGEELDFERDPQEHDRLWFEQKPSRDPDFDD